MKDIIISKEYPTDTIQTLKNARKNINEALEAMLEECAVFDENDTAAWDGDPTEDHFHGEVTDSNWENLDFYLSGNISGATAYGSLTKKIIRVQENIAKEIKELDGIIAKVTKK